MPGLLQPSQRLKTEGWQLHQWSCLPASGRSGLQSVPHLHPPADHGACCQLGSRYCGCVGHLAIVTCTSTSTSLH